jgi:hypothetical protein
MANHDIPRTRTRVTEQLFGVDVNRDVVCLRVYEHVRQGHDPAFPDFYVLQFRYAGRRMDRSSRVTTQLTGRNARARLDAELAEARPLLAATLLTEADRVSAELAAR